MAIVSTELEVQDITTLPKRTASGIDPDTDFVLGVEENGTAYKADIEDLGQSIVQGAKSNLLGRNQTVASAFRMLREETNEKIKESYGAPLVANQASDMKDKTRVYVYTGHESGYHHYGWYYWNNVAWTLGGEYNAGIVTTDVTLTLADMPADSKAVGDVLDEVNTELSSIADDLEQLQEDSNGYAASTSIVSEYSPSGIYAVGDYCMHDGTLYRCTTAISTAEAWNASHWTADNVKNIVDSLKGDVSDLKDDLSDAVTQSGIVFTKNIVTGKSINANVGGSVSIVDNDNRMYYSFKVNRSFKVNILGNDSGHSVAIIVSDKNNICLLNTGWDYRKIQSITISQDSIVYVLCNFTDTSYVPDAYIESEIIKYFTDELSSSAPIWEYGSITSSNGNDNNDDKTSVRTIDRLYFYGIKVFVGNSNYRVKAFSYNEDGTYSSNTNWITDSGVIMAEASKRYRLQISTVSGSDIVLKDALQNVRIVQMSSFGSSESRLTELNQKAIEKGYLCSIPLEWESGSITSSGANKDNDPNVIRTPLPPMNLNGNLKIFMDDTQYRYRFYYYNSTGETFVDYSSWFTTAGESEYSINPNYTYRIQIATQNASQMDIDDALSRILFCYAGDTIIDKIPPYWVDYLHNKTDVINSYLTDGNNKSVFLFLTDTHWNEDPTYLNHYGINAALLKHVSSECNIGTLIHGGDLNSEYRTNKNIARKLMTRPVELMREAFDNVLLTRGNHDDNIEGSNNVWSYVITQSDAYSYMFRNTQNAVFGNSGTYFYYDIPHEKLRIISLDCVDFPYKNTVDSTKSDLKILAFGYDQLQWLCDSLKDTPSGYHIVIYTHAMLAPSAVTVDYPSTSPQTRALNYLTVCELLKAYKNRQTFTETMNGSFVSVHKDYYTGELSGNFTSCDATIVGVFSGHEHIDCIEEILDRNGAGIGIYNTCTQNSSNLFANTVISHSYQHPMEIGTTTELVWDVVVIDRKNKHVDMIRVGAYAANEDVEAVDVRSFNY